MLRPFKAVFFDAGGTLLYPYPSVGEIYQRVGEKHGCRATSAELQNRFLECWKELEGLSKLTDHCNGRPQSMSGFASEFVVEKNERDWWKNLVQKVFSSFGGIQDFEGFFNELYDLFASPEAWRLYPEVESVLETLKNEGKKLIIVSNWDSRLFGLCEKLKIASYFDSIMASAVFGASKPSATIFQEALKRSAVSPEQAVHIGDSYEDDIKGANSAGVQAVLIDRHRHHEVCDELPVKPLATIKDLMELLKFS